MGAAIPVTRGAAVLVLAAWAAAASARTTAPRLTELSLDELANIEVTSVSRYGESIATAPAAVFVITADDIRRSGVTTLAEALRLAPNLQVARVDTGQYAITARGFNGVVANKLLVLVDGRTVYTPLLGRLLGSADVFLEDVERIEIISGPGASLWGSNAVNGVINVTTRSARDTHGTLVSGGGGNREQVAGVRYGAALGDSGHIRVYGKGTHTACSHRADRAPVLNEREWLQAGFRAEWGDDAGAFTLQGDAYRIQTEDRGSIAGFVLGRGDFTGQNLLARWTRRPGNGSDLLIQAYVDHADRGEPVLFQPSRVSSTSRSPSA
jgi:iron complex outermembrane receptor protein